MNVRDETIRKHDERMATNEEVLGPRKTMFVLVIVVGCFAVLWPRILSPLVLGSARDQLQPNKFDRDAGCCDVMFGTELTVLELIDAVCSAVVHNGKSPLAASECRKAVNETCGVDITAFAKRSDNIGKSSRLLVQTMQGGNSSCLKEHFGVPVDFGQHPGLNSWTLTDTIKQERPPIRGAGPHPALRERGRAIPPGAPSPQVHIQMPPNVRVRTSPLSGYFELDIKPPPIPGMRPPLGSPGGPVPAPKTSMGFVMPIYTICIIVFFVYTISKLLFKRATIPYEPVAPDPQFRRRVFRDDSRSSPDKLVVTAISGLVAEVQQQMDAQNQQRQDVQDNGRPYTNGTIIHNSGPVHIFASEYNESKAKDPSPEPKEPQTKTALEEVTEEPEEVVLEKEKNEVSEAVLDDKDEIEVQKDNLPDKIDVDVSSDIPKTEVQDSDKEEVSDTKVPQESEEKLTTDLDDVTKDLDVEQDTKEEIELPEDSTDLIPKKDEEKQETVTESNLIDLTEPIELKRNGDIGKTVEDFLREEAKDLDRIDDEAVQELLAAAEDDDDDEQKSSVKVMGMELRAHSADGGAPQPAPPPPARPAPQAAEEVKSIYLETAIPQQSRVLVADFAENRTDDTPPNRHSPMVVSGKMTLSLIQDAVRDTPDRDLESTVDDFTTASAFTQHAKKEGSESEEEIEEEIEVEEIEEEVEEEVVEEEVVEEEVVDEEEEEAPEQATKLTEQDKQLETEEVDAEEELKKPEKKKDAGENLEEAIEKGTE